MAAGQGILSLAIKDKNSLYSAYISYVKNGGLFIPTTKPYRLGEEVFLLLTLLEDPERLPIAGKIIWITPEGASGNRSPGIGVQFNGQDGGKVKTKIVSSLGGMLQTERSTHTM